MSALSRLRRGVGPDLRPGRVEERAEAVLWKIAHATVGFRDGRALVRRFERRHLAEQRRAAGVAHVESQFELGHVVSEMTRSSAAGKVAVDCRGRIKWLERQFGISLTG